MYGLQDWMKRTQPVLMRVQPASGTDDHSFRQLVKSLREKNLVSPRWRHFHSTHALRQYALTGWEIPGTGRTTTNLFIMPFAQGLLGVAFPVSGMPEMPKALDPAVRQGIFNMLPSQIRS